MELRTRPNPYGWPCEDDGQLQQSPHWRIDPNIDMNISAPQLGQKKQKTGDSY